MKRINWEWLDDSKLCLDAYNKESEHLGFLQWPLTAKGATIIVCLGLTIYLLAFIMYLLVRKVVKQLDISEYEKLTGGINPTLHWEPLRH